MLSVFCINTLHSPGLLHTFTCSSTTISCTSTGLARALAPQAHQASSTLQARDSDLRRLSSSFRDGERHEQHHQEVPRACFKLTFSDRTAAPTIHARRALAAWHLLCPPIEVCFVRLCLVPGCDSIKNAEAHIHHHIDIRNVTTVTEAAQLILAIVSGQL